MAPSTSPPSMRSTSSGSHARPTIRCGECSAIDIVLEGRCRVAGAGACDAVRDDSVGRCCVFVVTGWPMICASADWYRVSPPDPVPFGESPPIGSIDASSGSVLGVAGKFARASRSARSFLDGIPIDRFIFLYAISSGDFFLEADAMASSVTPDAAPAVAQRSLALLFQGVECGSFFAPAPESDAFELDTFVLGGSTDANAAAPRGFAASFSFAAFSFFDGMPIDRFTALYASMKPLRFFVPGS